MKTHTPYRADIGQALGEAAVPGLGHYDPVTQLPGAAYFHAVLARRLAQGEAAPQGLVHFNLDRFAGVNDAYGRATGDALLALVARRLEASAGADDLVAHLGADEFALLLTDVRDARAARARAHGLLRELRRPFTLGAQTFYLTASVGVAVSTGCAVEPLLAAAGKALTEAKRGGRNTYCIDAGPEAHAQGQRMQLETALGKAIARDELFLVYQPTLNLHTRRISSVEALLRWRHPERGVLTPDSFVQLANDTGLMDDIGPWVLAGACEQVRRWQQQGFPDLSVSVNFSSAQLKAPRLAQSIEAALQASGLDAHALDVETHEIAALREDRHALDNFHALKEMGVKLSLDNFGTGLVSLAQLAQLPMDALKIDRSFVRQACCGGANLLRSLTALGKSLQLGVVAGGVETAEQLSLLDGEGCDEFQGYLLAKPQGAAGVLGLLHQYNSPGAAP
jgi:diguanylate cyclase (GGDEF)-like protein